MIDLTGRVGIVTGAGGGLGRAHALLLARRGAKVVVNDFEGPGGSGQRSRAQTVVEEILAAGGQALVNGASVADNAQVVAMVAATLSEWGRIDILVNNAGILRDRTFSKMSLEDFRAVIEVHLMGAVHCIKAVWETMRVQRYGRVVFTTSSSGLYGNFGQSNYGAAKMALVGLMQTLALEGEKHDIRVNCLAPSAATRMTAGLLPERVLELITPESVSPGVLALVAEDAPTRTILCAGGGAYEQAHVTLTRGIFVRNATDAAEQVAASWRQIAERQDERIPATGLEQAMMEAEKAGYCAKDRPK